MAARRARMTRVAAAGVAVMLIGVTVAAAFLVRERGLRREAERQKSEAERQKAVADAINIFFDRTLTSIDPDELGKDVTLAKALAPTFC